LFLQPVHDEEVDSQLLFSPMKSGVYFVERWILRTASIWVQKIQKLCTKCLNDEKTCVWCAMNAGCEFSAISEELEGVNCVFCSCAQCNRWGTQLFEHLL